MKRGVKPTRRQKEILSRYRLNTANWLVVKALSNELHIVHRYTGRVRKIPV